MVRIIADTLSCITVQEAKSLGIPLLPQIIIFGEESYRDDTEIDTKTFLDKLKKSKELPKTAAPAPALYTPILEQIIADGDTPFIICPTNELSGTYRSAVIAAKDFHGVDIRIVDTQTLGAGLGSLVRQAIKWAAEGDQPDQIEIKLKEMASRQRLYFMVATLEYLYKGGRIGGAQAFLGSVLQVKPILQLQNGKIEPAGSQRTQKKAINYLIQLTQENCSKGENAHLSVMHGGEIEEAMQLVDKLKEISGQTDIPIYDLPAAILVHGGPGAFGISFFGDTLAIS